MSFTSVPVPVPAKETLYKTAYSLMFKVYVSIAHAHQDEFGVWIFTCNSDYDSKAILKDHLFRSHELINFVL